MALRVRGDVGEGAVESLLVVEVGKRGVNRRKIVTFLKLATTNACSGLRRDPGADQRPNLTPLHNIPSVVQSRGKPMTAILAFATKGLAFVAGDTKRVTAFAPAIKVHRWSTTVVFAQAGNGSQLPSLIGQMTAVRPIMGENIQGFENAFAQLRKHFHDQALAAKAQARVPHHVDTDGTLLVADAASGVVISLDFASGHRSPPQAPFGTGGVPQLAAQAANRWGALAPALDLWAVASIGACVGITVSWPIDALVVRPHDPAGSLTVQRRYEIGWNGPDDPLFRA